MKKYLQIISIALVLTVSIVFAGCDVNSSSSASQETGKITSMQQTDTTSSKAKKAPTIGEYIKNDKWKISLLNAKTYSKIGENEYLLDKAADGKEFLVLFFEVENVSDEDDYFNYFNIDSYVDEYSADLKVLLNDVDDYDYLSGNVKAGKKLKGCLAWEVDKNWKEIEVSYKELFSNDEAATFVVKSKQVKNK